MLRKIRITLAAIMMVLVTLLFLDVSGVLHHYLSWTARISRRTASWVLAPS